MATSLELLVKWLPPWYCSLVLHLLLGNVWLWSAFEKRDLILVGHVPTASRYRPLSPSISQLRRLVPYCFQTAATPPAAHTPSLWALLFACVDDRDCLWGCLCLFLEDSCLLPLSSR